MLSDVQCADDNVKRDNLKCDNVKCESVQWIDWDSSSTSSSSSYDTTSPDWLPVCPKIPEASQAFTCTTISPSSKLQASRGKNMSCKKWYVKAQRIAKIYLLCSLPVL